MARILMLVSSAKVMRLADGTLQPTGYFVDEAYQDERIPKDRTVADAGIRPLEFVFVDYVDE